MISNTKQMWSTAIYQSYTHIAQVEDTMWSHMENVLRDEVQNQGL
jgi:hypothetical protein